jgi:hypothetical protein
MLAIAGLPANTQNPQPAEQMLTNMLANFTENVKIGQFTAFARVNAVQFFDGWPVDDRFTCTNPINAGQCLSLENAPVHLNAIVNRVDIGQNGSSDQAGQLRFVFGVTLDLSGNQCSSSGGQPFNIILEYNVPPNTLTNGFTAQSWAQAWQALSAVCVPVFSTNCAQQTFDPALLQITNRVVTVGAGGAGTINGSALFDLRTNELLLGSATNPGQWEMRQFQLATTTGSLGTLVETVVPQTPDLSFDGGEAAGLHGQPQMFCTISNQTPACGSLGLVASLIETNQTAIQNGTFTLPSNDAGVSALNGPSGVPPENFLVFWNSFPSMIGIDPDTRVIFAASPQLTDTTQGGIDGTCNGCHGAETQIAFQQVVNRTSGTGHDVASLLSGFLVGCNTSTGIISPCPQPPTCTFGSQGCVFALNSAGAEPVQDPVNASQTNFFGDIQRRLNCMNKILNPNSPTEVKCDGAGN